MENQRKQSRIKFELQCQLITHDENVYQALLEDISLGGALININDEFHLQVGDTCDLILSEKSAAIPVKRRSKIVRIESQNICVSFLS